MTARIVHVFPDSPFLPFTAELFESVAPGSNTFLVYAPQGPLDRHALPETATVEAVSADQPGRERVAAVARNSDIVIAHSMGPLGAHAVLSAPSRSLKVWSGWGGDYYGSDFSIMAGLLGPESEAYYRSRLSLGGKTLGPLLRYRANRVYHRAARVSNVFSAPVPDDLGVFAKRFPEFQGRYAQLNYASVDDALSLGPLDGPGDDILVGNSATLPNNHFEVLELLNRVGVDGRRVVVPLSYGDPVYADAVVKRGTELLGAAFLPLRDFLPLVEYQSIVSGCSVVVMGHRRQQGVGNIIGALWEGAHLFLDERNPVSGFLRARGAVSGTLGELERTGLPHGRVTSEQLQANRRLAQSFWGRSTVLANVEELVAAV